MCLIYCFFFMLRMKKSKIEPKLKTHARWNSFRSLFSRHVCVRIRLINCGNYEESCQTHWEFRDWTKRDRAQDIWWIAHEWMPAGFCITGDAPIHRHRYVHGSHTFCALSALLNFCAIDSRMSRFFHNFFSFIMNKTRHIKNEFWRHKCYMGILIGIICGMRKNTNNIMCICCCCCCCRFIFLFLYFLFVNGYETWWLGYFFLFSSWNKILLALI